MWGQSIHPAVMPRTQLDRIEAMLVAAAVLQTRIELEQRQQTGLLSALTAGDQLMATTLAEFATQLAAATTAEAQALDEQNQKIDSVQSAIGNQGTQIDGVQAELTSIFERLQAGNPVSQADLDSISSSLTTLGGTRAAIVAQGERLGTARVALEAQGVRLTAMAVDPANPVPLSPSPTATFSTPAFR